MENPNFTGIGKKYVENPSEEGDLGVGTGKVDSLKEVISEINDMVGERKKLSGGFFRDAEKMKREISNFLLESAPAGEGDSEFVRERSELRKKQMDVTEMQLNERVGCWRDIALLKKELREREKELSERLNRADMLGKILEDGD